MFTIITSKTKSEIKKFFKRCCENINQITLICYINIITKDILS